MFSIYLIRPIAEPRQHDHAHNAVEVPPFDDEIRRLCALAAVASDEEAESILKELQKLLQEHNEYVRHIAAETLKRLA